MIETNKIFNRAYLEIDKLWEKYEVLSNFAKLPKDLELVNFNTNKLPVTEKLSNFNSNLNSSTKDLHDAIKDLTYYVNWEPGYGEEDVGKDFLNKYGFFELIGPTGHFQTSEMALYVNYLDQNTHYPLHNHEAEELYFVLSGEAKFESENEKSEILTSTKTRFHKSYQQHAITTTNQQVLSIVIWKNKFENISKIIHQ